MSCRMQRLLGIGFGLSLWGSSVSWAVVQVTSVDFDGSQDPVEIKIEGTGPLTYEKKENVQDKQIVIELRDASISTETGKKIDTSSFKSNVSMVSSYPVEGKKNHVRVVVQLKEAVTGELNQVGNALILKVPQIDRVPEPLLSKEENTHLDQFMATQVTQRFTGKPISFQVRDAEVVDVLRLIGEASGFNMVISDEVKGKVTLALTDVPWDQALDVVMQSLRLGAERKDSILRVMPLGSLLVEKTEKRNAENAAKAVSPRVTRVFPVSYASLADLTKTVTAFLGDAGDGGEKPLVQADARTNSLIVRDTVENIEKMKKLVEILDTQTPQVMIEAKVVEATEGFTKSLGGSLGIGGANNGSTFVGGFSGGNPLDPLIGSAGVFKSGSTVSSTGSGTVGFSPAVSFIPGVTQLNAILSLAESENQIKVVSAPKTVVLNKENASIVQGTPIQVPGTTFVAGVGNTPTTSVQQANISLNVTPTVTNDGSVQMKLSVSKDIVFSFSDTSGGIGNRTMNTLVLVESGSTLVIGGIYTMDSRHDESGFPFLRKLPLLGALFGSEKSSTNRSELFFFVTPRILNLKESGLNG